MVGVAAVALVVVAVVGAGVVVPVAAGVGVAFGVALHAFLVVSSAVGPHPLLPLPVDVATIVELAEHRVKYAGRVRKLWSASFHAMVSTSVVQAMSTTGA